jgi:hypothetical protein
MGITQRIKELRIEYDPLPSQKLFHSCTERFKGFSGPIGSGKSLALCHEAIRLSYENAGRMGLLGAPTYPMLREATQASLLQILAANQIRYEHNKAENTLLLTDTRSRILFRPVDEFERLRGTNLAWFGIDELTYTQEEAWLRLEGRLRDPKANRHCGFAVWTPKGYDWVYRRFLNEPVKGYRAIVARASENRHLLAKNPDFYERLKHSYDDQFYRQEVLGEYLSQDGCRVYTAFDRKLHLMEPRKADRRYPLYWTLDFNIDPMSSVVAQIIDDVVYVLDEIVIRRATTDMACEEFLRRYPRHDAGVAVIGDCSGYKAQTTGESDYNMIQQYFAEYSALRVSYEAPRRNPGVRDRVNRMNRQLQTAAGDIGLQVSRHCKELIKDFEEVTYKGGAMEIDKEHDKMRTHLSDALGYLVVEKCRTERGLYGEGRLL